MDIFGARAILREANLFAFEESANKVLKDYLVLFGPSDEYESQFRSNIASIGAAEVSVLRGILSGRPAVEPRRPVLEQDVTFAVLTADTLRTRPCRTTNAARRGRFSTSDLFMFSGDASKAWYVLDDQHLNVSALDSVESFLDLGKKLYEVGREQMISLPEVVPGFDRMTTFFAFLRMKIIRNENQSEATKSALALGRTLRLLGLAEREM